MPIINGQVYLYFKQNDGNDPDRPAIEFLENMTYRFIR
jgi:hypothetical protein